jgi:hypothetical protein
MLQRGSSYSELLHQAVAKEALYRYIDRMLPDIHLIYQIFLLLIFLMRYYYHCLWVFTYSLLSVNC